MAVVIPVSFKNKEKYLLEYVKDKDFSYYVKQLIKKDMKSKEKEI
ncbi:hypothetical protein [Inconstantimicrobium mannanitabidum]|uniref:Uncharacterized protein n=1 Tax=Inconstantimicrobium mannanitabidum TaxID=1604901 RepID=A0ACB5R9F9_9CLOT|nr:hypothetical protein [Clostridium sp. TW13]GKX65659.1 hypothetical protein rsdtw13_09170 [Clostridium sp. TW13]